LNRAISKHSHGLFVGVCLPLRLLSLNLIRSRRWLLSL